MRLEKSFKSILLHCLVSFLAACSANNGPTQSASNNEQETTFITEHSGTPTLGGGTADGSGGDYRASTNEDIDKAFEKFHIRQILLMHRLQRIKPNWVKSDTNSDSSPRQFLIRSSNRIEEDPIWRLHSLVFDQTPIAEIYIKISQLTLHKREAPCRSVDGHETAMAIHEDRVCISYKILRQIPKSDLIKQIDALSGHEVIHALGISDEEVASQLQQMIIEDYSFLVNEPTNERLHFNAFLEIMAIVIAKPLLLKRGNREPLPYIQNIMSLQCKGLSTLNSYAFSDYELWRNLLAHIPQKISDLFSQYCIYREPFTDIQDGITRLRKLHQSLQNLIWWLKQLDVRITEDYSPFRSIDLSGFHSKLAKELLLSNVALEKLVSNLSEDSSKPAMLVQKIPQCQFDSAPLNFSENSCPEGVLRDYDKETVLCSEASFQTVDGRTKKVLVLLSKPRFGFEGSFNLAEVDPEQMSLSPATDFTSAIEGLYQVTLTLEDDPPRQQPDSMLNYGGELAPAIAAFQPPTRDNNVLWSLGDQHLLRRHSDNPYNYFHSLEAFVHPRFSPKFQADVRFLKPSQNITHREIHENRTHRIECRLD